jgi:Mn-dependent DtxR family transcriptional regulator
MPSDTQDADIDLTPGSPKSDIVAVLYGNPDNKFRVEDIRERLDIPQGEITTTLTQLTNGGLIGEAGDRYYALDQRDDLRRYVASLSQLEMMFGDKSYDEHTTIDDSLEEIDEDELDAELAELEAELDKE